MAYKPIPIKLVIHWPRFGPYHLARLQAAHAWFQAHNAQLIGLETAGQDSTYAWREEEHNHSFQRMTVVAEGVAENLTRRQIWASLNPVLKQIAPDVIAINGYSAPDSQMLLWWCKRNRVPAVLMSDSKYDDAPRSALKENVKRLFVRQYAAALCAGAPHRQYLEQLGMKPETIFTGYDVVDNDFFWQRAQRVRQHPNNHRHLPGLQDSIPFFLASSRFIARKNLIGLLRAYQLYRDQCRHQGVSPWRLVILGDGEERPPLEEFIFETKLNGVTLAGFRQIDELPMYYGLASVFVHSALQDQWGLVVNEAMASGLPLLVSERCGCVPDLIRSGLNGYTFNPGSVAELADLLVRCTGGKVDLNAMGQASLVIIADWNLDRFAEGLWQAAQASVGN